MKETTSRRQFFGQAGALIGAGLTLPVLTQFLTSCAKNEGPSNVQDKTMAVKISDYPDLATVGNSVKVKSNKFNNGITVLIYRKSNVEFLTYTTKCTHQGCEVDLPSAGEIHCPCHGSIYSAANGSVIKGPAPLSLPSFQNTFDSQTGVLTITG